MISHETIDAINRSVRLVDLISEKIELKRRGSNYIGLCPFHGERSPSFQVKADENFYHCFGCGASGGAIAFVMQSQGLSFPEAVENLAQRLGISIKRTDGVQRSDNRDQKQAILAANDFALRYFQMNLKSAPSAVLEYVKSRGLNQDLCESFQIGFAPMDWGGLPQHLKKMGVSEATALAAGLAKRNSKGELYGFYRGRLVFPIFGDSKKVIGFGGRLIPVLFTEEERETQAKYLNSPETIVYQKSKVLYGLEHALAEIRAGRCVYVVEGYLDVIGMNAGGVGNAVATCGTALTKEHLKRLARLTTKINLLFDGDNAGREAAAKCFPIFINSGVDAKALFLAQGEDPHSMYMTHGSALAEQIKNAEQRSLLECYLISLLRKEGVLSVTEMGPAAKQRVAESIAEIVLTVEKPVEREHLISNCSFLLDLSNDVKNSLFKGNPSKRKDDSSYQNSNQARSQFQANSNMATQEDSQRPNTEKVSIANSSNISGLPVELHQQALELERTIVRTVIANRSDFPAKVLGDARLCSVLSDRCLEFVQSVRAIADASDLSEDDRKSQVRELIALGGAEYMALWKQAREMTKDRSIDFSRLLDECCESAQRLGIKRSLAEINQAIKSTDDSAEKLKLVQQQLELAKLARK